MAETTIERACDNNFRNTESIQTDIGEGIVAENSLKTSATRSVYLITYSQADLQKFTCRADFAKKLQSRKLQCDALVLQLRGTQFRRQTLSHVLKA